MQRIQKRKEIIHLKATSLRTRERNFSFLSKRSAKRQVFLGGEPSETSEFGSLFDLRMRSSFVDHPRPKIAHRPAPSVRIIIEKNLPCKHWLLALGIILSSVPNN
jgi:hypothetical protein